MCVCVVCVCMGQKTAEFAKKMEDLVVKDALKTIRDQIADIEQELVRLEKAQYSKFFGEGNRRDALEKQLAILTARLDVEEKKLLIWNQ